MKKKPFSWRSQAFRGLLYQIFAVVAIGLAIWFLAHNTATNMRIRGIQSGFDFLTSAAGFDIGESLYPFDSGEPYWRAFLIGVTNTLRVAVLGIVLTTILGTLIGIGRFSRNVLVRGLCATYVEVFRNIPILLQLLMWYLLFTELLPASTEPLVLGPLFLSKGGLNFPIPIWASGHAWTAWLWWQDCFQPGCTAGTPSGCLNAPATPPALSGCRCWCCWAVGRWAGCSVVRQQASITPSKVNSP